MKREEFLRKLSEVADWHIPKLEMPARDWAYMKNKACTENNEDDDNDQEQDTTTMALATGRNPTAAPELLGLKNQSRACEDCGTTCTKGRVTEKIRYEYQGQAIWRERCRNCGMSKDPFTGKFDVDPLDMTNKYRQWLLYLRTGEITPTAKNPTKKSDKERIG